MINRLKQTSLFSFYFLILLSTSLIGKDNSYAVSNIPLSLRDGEAVIRKDIMNIEIKDIYSTQITVIIAVTIFKAEKRSFGEKIVWYDKYRKITNFSGTLYDDNGEEIRSLSNSEIEDYSAVSETNLYDDYRVKRAELYHNRYPYTIEFEYSVTQSGSLHFPSWISRATIDPVEMTSFSVTVPAKMNLRYWCNKDTIQPKIMTGSSTNTYVWEENDLVRLSKDAFGDSPEDYGTLVHIALNEFELDNISGDMSSWESLGKWNSKLFYDDSDELDAEAIVEIERQYLPGDDVRTKLKKLYSFLQNKTRYISVQLGIGGWKPFPAMYVYEHGYGDCKALTNYMRVILAHAGIKSYPVLITLGHKRYPFIKEFPSNQFNHLILSVPIANDTVYLECTSNTLPAGVIHEEIENRGALMLFPDGGKVISMPKSTPSRNLQIRNANVVLRALGKSDIKITVSWQGNEREDIRSLLSVIKPQEKDEWVLNSLHTTNVTIDKYIINNSDSLASTSLDYTAGANFVTSSGNRLFFQPNLTERWTATPPNVAKRYSPVRFRYPFCDIDTINYILPARYKVEALPAETNLLTDFGEYHSKVIQAADNSLIYIRTCQIKTYSIPAERYNEYRKFIADIVKSDNAKAVLIME